MEIIEYMCQKIVLNNTFEWIHWVIIAPRLLLLCRTAVQRSWWKQSFLRWSRRAVQRWRSSAIYRPSDWRSGGQTAGERRGRTELRGFFTDSVSGWSTGAGNKLHVDRQQEDERWSEREQYGGSEWSIVNKTTGNHLNKCRLNFIFM